MSIRDPSPRDFSIMTLPVGSDGVGGNVRLGIAKGGGALKGVAPPEM